MLLSNISKEQLTGFIEDLPLLGAELVLVVTLLVLVFADLVLKKVNSRYQILSVLFVIGVGISTYMSFHYVSACECLFLQGGLFTDETYLVFFTKQSVFLKFLMGLCTILLVAYNNLSFKQSSSFEEKGEYFVVITSILLGAFLLTSSTNFLMTLLAIEITSFGAYGLVYFGGTAKAKEASLKYILYGLVATGLMLFGMSWLYLSTGSLGYELVIESFTKGETDVFLVGGLLFMLAGFMFKLGTVPFHIWIPDAFEGGPTSGVAYLSLVPKIGALSGLVLLFSAIQGVEFYGVNFQMIFLILGVITMTMGNFFALAQNNIKRLLGYSSIAHSGLLLIALGVGGSSGLNSLFFYLVVYVFMNLSAFLCADYFIKQTGSEDIRDWKGYGAKGAFMSVVFVIPILALIGLPPTAGFNAKLFVFTALLELAQSTDNNIVLAVLIISVFNIIISLFYYLKVPFYLFFQKSEGSNGTKLSVLTKLQVLLFVAPLVVIFVTSSKVMLLIEKVNFVVKYFIK